MVQWPPDAQEGATAGEARARAVDDLSVAEAARVLSENVWDNGESESDCTPASNRDPSPEATKNDVARPICSRWFHLRADLR